MARPKEFDPEQVLKKIMELFWKNGYYATSIDDILAVTGIGRKSLYDTFGDKQALYLAALRFYGKTNDWRLAQLEDRKGNIKDIIQPFFEALLNESVCDQDRKGCFTVNAALEMAQHDPEVAKRVDACLDRTSEAFYRILVTAKEAGQLTLKYDPRNLADYFLNAYMGLRVLGRTKPERHLLESIVSTTLSILD
ncbi:TetR/AcrR family transcriptional regulator [Paenibacillus sp. 2TAB23]|uniref:TetR/AcrR family transcriptional regulator n=1 Tax=Paenibacillus sp. 2TAB23 TaxID=3233004 RepID=UPI003F9567A2